MTKMRLFFIIIIMVLGITACGGERNEDIENNMETPIPADDVVVTDNNTIVEATPEPVVTEAPKVTVEVAPEHKEDFELMLSIKLSEGITDYTYEDYLADLEIKAKKEEDNSKINVEDTEDLDANKEVIKQTIIKDIARYNQYIYDHCGYSEAEYGVGPHAIAEDPNVKNWSLYNGVMTYMDMLVDYAGGKRSNVLGSEVFEISADQQVLGLRGAMFNGIPYEQDAKFGEYYYILANFLADGHPDITSVENLSLEYVNELMDFDGYQVAVIANFTCNGESYTCWLQGVAGSADGAYYTVLDLKKN